MKRLPLDLRVRELEGQIEASRKTRPSKEFVCAQWASIMEIWEEATEGERTEIMQGIVKRVEVGQKEEETCKLATSPQVPSRWLTLTNQMGAGRLIVAKYPPISFPDFEVPRISRKTWKPRDSETDEC